jgi:hypothetical protein
MSTNTGNAGKGRRKGSRNRLPQEAREVLTAAIKSLSPNLEDWIRSVADGKRAKDPLMGNMVWERRPDPGLAASLTLQLAEYSVPKLARTEVANAQGQTLAITYVGLPPPGKSE